MAVSSLRCDDSKYIKRFANYTFVLENLFLASTYKSVLNLIAKGALAKAELKTSTRVTSFKSNIQSGQPTSVTITTAANHNIDFDEG